jgi:hypothetical protein
MNPTFTSIFELNAYLKKVEEERKVARRERKMAYFQNQQEWAELRQRSDPYFISKPPMKSVATVKAI